MKFLVYQRSEQAGRKNNQDRVGYVYTKESALFIVADGMGGHANGELAAQIALESMTESFERQALPMIPNPSEFLSSSFIQAHHQILHFSHDQGLSDTPRTTLTALMIQDGYATWAHCGDSRLYWLRDGALKNRTRDHSYAEKNSADDPSLNREYLSKHANRHVLFTCLGASTQPICDLSATVKMEAGDKFLLSTDGLWSSIQEEDMLVALTSAPVTQSVPWLIDLAIKNGGIHGDNVTAIGVEWKGN